MKKKIGVLLIHGAGKSQFGPQIKFVEKINKALNKKGVETSSIVFEHVDWYEPTQTIQEKLWSRIKQDRKKIGARKVREFVLYLVSDMVAYTGTPNRESESYNKTHELIFKSVEKLENQVGSESPLVIIASSLGTSIINDYIWDRQKLIDGDPWIKTPFQRFDTLSGFFLFGNNIPLFMTGYDPDEWKPIKFPSENLDTALKKHASWINYYDKQDPLGFPMKNVNEHFKESLMIDKEINVGNPLISWNIGSHLAYWKSRKLRNEIVNYLQLINKTDI